MAMVLDNKRFINDVPPQMARNIVRECYPDPYSLEILADKFEVAKIAMQGWLQKLSEIDFLEIEEEDGEAQWCCTPNGYARLVLARYGSPLTAHGFIEQIKKVKARAKEYNDTNRYPYHIDCIYIFGPVLNHFDSLDDPSFAVSFSLKSGISKKGRWYDDYYEEYGPDRNLGILDTLFFPKNEMAEALKRRREHFDVFLQNVKDLSDDWRIVFFEKKLTKKERSRLLNEEDLSELEQHLTHARNMALEERKERRRITASHESILAFWEGEDSFRSLGIDSERAASSCWRCSSQREIQRCHIVPKALGGKDAKENYVLLCKRCHAEAPNVIMPQIMWDWISAYRAHYPNDLWSQVALKEYEFLYGKSLGCDIQMLLEQTDADIDLEEAMALFDLLANEAITQATHHFGQSYFNTATMVGVYRIAMQRLKELFENPETLQLYRGI